jgi:hypothetical protein
MGFWSSPLENEILGVILKDDDLEHTYSGAGGWSKNKVQL